MDEELIINIIFEILNLRNIVLFKILTVEKLINRKKMMQKNLLITLRLKMNWVAQFFLYLKNL